MGSVLRARMGIRPTGVGNAVVGLGRPTCRKSPSRLVSDSIDHLVGAAAFRTSRGWRVTWSSTNETGPDCAELFPAWSDGTCSVFRFRNDKGRSKYFYRYNGLAEAIVNFATWHVDLLALAPACTEASLDHFWTDIILPAALDHRGELVLHAGAVVIDGVAAVFLGDSGRGKSTLTASFYSDGYTVLSDDGVIITPTGAGASVEAVYPGIRLLPITLSDIFADPIATTEVAHYASKRRIVPDARMSPASFPVGALFFLSEPTGSGMVSIRPVGAADACIGIVSKSFALDPSDTVRARSRIEQAGRLANALPTFALDYPRDISALPQVRQAIAEALSLGD